MPDPLVRSKKEGLPPAGAVNFRLIQGPSHRSFELFTYFTIPVLATLPHLDGIRTRNSSHIPFRHSRLLKVNELVLDVIPGYIDSDLSNILKAFSALFNMHNLQYIPT